MTTVQTVTGPVDGADLGRTLVHEHIRISYNGEELDPTYAWDRADTVERAVDKMGELLDAGFRTFVDPCPIELGRDPELYAEISSRSGMHIVCTTGFYTEHLGLGAAVLLAGARSRGDRRALRGRSSTRASPGTGGIRAGAIKAATGTEVTPAESRCLTGAALAQREVGCAIITHTENSRHGDVQQDLFADGGADLGRVLIGHQDEQTDVAPIRKLAERGTFVGVDRIGLEILAPDERRADHVAALVREGFTSQVCLSQDHICALTAPRARRSRCRRSTARRPRPGARRSRGRCGSGRTPTSSPTSCPASSSAGSPTPTSRRSSSTTRGGCSPAVDRASARSKILSRLTPAGASPDGLACQGSRPSISTSSEKLRMVRMSTMSASAPTFSIDGSTATVRMRSAATRISRLSRMVRPDEAAQRAVDRRERLAASSARPACTKPITKPIDEHRDADRLEHLGDVVHGLVEGHARHLRQR